MINSKNLLVMLLTTGLGSFSFLFPSNAMAVSITKYQEQAFLGQRFYFNFSGLSRSAGNGGILILRAQGNYGPAASKILWWDAENMTGSPGLGGYEFNDPSNAPTQATGGLASGMGGLFDFVDGTVGGDPNSIIHWQRTYELDALLLDSLLADGEINITAELSPGVGLNANLPSFVEYTLNYDDVSTVPVPAALPLFGSGLALAGFIGWRRKRKSA